MAAGTEAPGGRIRDWFRQSHEILRRWAESGETAEDYPELDRIRGEFDAAAALFHAARVALSDAVTGGSSRDSGALEIAEEMPAPADAKAAFETALKTAQTLGAAPQDEADRAVLYAQMQKSLRLMQIAQTRAHEAELTAVLSSHRRQARRVLNRPRRGRTPWKRSVIRPRPLLRIATQKLPACGRIWGIRPGFAKI